MKNDRLPLHHSGFVQEIKQEDVLEQKFNQVQPPQTKKVQHPRMPPVVMDLGELVGVIYRSNQYCSGQEQPGDPHLHLHQMEDPPRLVSNVEGTQLYILGGSYRVTANGIEG
jgi:hypothetical protein